MKITTILDCMIRARDEIMLDYARRYITPFSFRRQRQYHAFRDGIHRRWIRMERPDPARASEVRRDEAGGVEQITQDGWKIAYLEYSDHRPRKIHVTREGLEIRLVIDEWLAN